MRNRDRNGKRTIRVLGGKSLTAVPGDGSPLKGYSLKQVFSRTLFFVELREPWGGIGRYAVDVHYDADELSERDPDEEEDSGLREEAASPVALYRDRVQVHQSDLPAVFPVPGGRIEVATTLYGLSRMHFVPDGGEARVLRPHPHSPEGLRASFARRAPRASRAVGRIAAVVLLAGLALTLPQGLETVTGLDLIAGRIGSFRSPVGLPSWANTTLVIMTTLAAIERALTLRRHWLIDIDTMWTGSD